MPRKPRSLSDLGSCCPSACVAVSWNYPPPSAPKRSGPFTQNVVPTFWLNHCSYYFTTSIPRKLGLALSRQGRGNNLRPGESAYRNSFLPLPLRERVGVRGESLVFFSVIASAPPGPWVWDLTEKKTRLSPLTPTLSRKGRGRKEFRYARSPGRRLFPLPWRERASPTCAEWK